MNDDECSNKTLDGHGHSFGRGRLRVLGGACGLAGPGWAPRGGINRYRLRIIDFDGAVSYSNAVEVLFASAEWVSVAPNPSRGLFDFKVGKFGEGELVVEIYNVAGQAVTTLVERDSPAGVRHLKADLSTVPSGVYLYRVRTGQQELNGRLLKID